MVRITWYVHRQPACLKTNLFNYRASGQQHRREPQRLMFQLWPAGGTHGATADRLPGL
ncbi:uncharacterized protein P884DRAFT_263654, partial [Thermothelomyces heterothallicus CBS 202.75]|uniref:uncharacterized protein n=1 Tax=Thermothelomyces heterothallicus CBS 202.75 TaxID=1149848 RepID=UPI003743CC5C